MSIYDDLAAIPPQITTIASYCDGYTTFQSHNQRVVSVMGTLFTTIIVKTREGIEALAKSSGLADTTATAVGFETDGTIRCASWDSQLTDGAAPNIAKVTFGSEWALFMSTDHGLTWKRVVSRITTYDMRPPTIEVFDKSNNASCLYVTHTDNGDGSDMTVDVYNASTMYTCPPSPIRTLVLPLFGVAKISTAVVNFGKCGTYCAALLILTRAGNGNNFAIVPLHPTTGLPLSNSPATVFSMPNNVWSAAEFKNILVGGKGNTIIRLLTNSGPGVAGDTTQYLQDPCLQVDTFALKVMFTMTSVSAYTAPAPGNGYSSVSTFVLDMRTLTLSNLNSEPITTIPFCMTPQPSNYTEMPLVPANSPTMLTSIINPALETYIQAQVATQSFHHYMISTNEAGGTRYVRVHKGDGVQKVFTNIVSIQGTPMTKLCLLWVLNTRLYTLCRHLSDRQQYYFMYSDNEGSTWTEYKWFKVPDEFADLYAATTCRTPVFDGNRYSLIVIAAYWRSPTVKRCITWSNSSDATAISVLIPPPLSF